ncbi:SACOL1771 family peroxiredoxin [Staphylococcus massiliensis]|uniref:SACOL1771 family peroxiredoxin n=1 Tax=Staphylococcus massiliensis TaxID=555791 RepID=UPI001EDCBE9E|nr:SACOL1771 family peroxiredoxin [Staphylococcus massiliensis]MCG3399743.1 SACOL1771 family peroxiredoxin [Staphylococcus massiliensis]
MITHDFHIETKWSGGRNKIGSFKSEHLDGNISIPTELGGVGEASNPDELLISAASSCYIISLAAALERARFEQVEIHMKSIGTATLNHGEFRMKSITHYPSIKVDASNHDRLEKRLPSLIEIADKHCMVSQSIKGNVEIQIDPQID